MNEIHGIKLSTRLAVKTGMRMIDKQRHDIVSCINGSERKRELMAFVYGNATVSLNAISMQCRSCNGVDGWPVDPPSLLDGVSMDSSIQKHVRPVYRASQSVVDQNVVSASKGPRFLFSPVTTEIGHVSSASQ
jgi:hypothetical protein